MNSKRVSLGFDLRVNPDLQAENPLQKNQHLVPELYSPVSADAMVWRETDEIESLTEGILPDFANPLHLAKSIELLVDACEERGIPTAGLWPVCITTLETNLIALAARYGPEYFESHPEEEEILSRGWRFYGLRCGRFRRLDQRAERLRVRRTRVVPVTQFLRQDPQRNWLV
jgi:hypothetical protein